MFISEIYSIEHGYAIIHMYMQVIIISIYHRQFCVDKYKLLFHDLVVRHDIKYILSINALTMRLEETRSRCLKLKTDNLHNNLHIN